MGCSRAIQRSTLVLLASLTWFSCAPGGDAEEGDTSAGGGGNPEEIVASGGGGEEVTSGGGRGEGATVGSPEEAFIEVTIDDEPHVLSQNATALIHPISGMSLNADQGDLYVGVYFSNIPDAPGTFECDGGSSIYITFSGEMGPAFDFISPDGFCTVEFTEVGEMFAGTFAGDVFIVGDPPLRIRLAEGRFRLPRTGEALN
jgi:hypothetical protein